FIIVGLPLFLFLSCLYSRAATPSVAVNAEIKIRNGSALLKIQGQVNENLYYVNIFDTQIKDEKNYENPAIREGTVTKNDTKYLSTGEEYKFSILPAEVVTINITSLDGNDVEIITRQYGKEKKYTLNGINKLGLSIAFQNR
ncbi:MAG: hypothetical protein LBD07_06760, partial [Spirochaetaceae bacterium]|nr:hypothetical protein [Spirochaetaceae bacterium]